MLIHYEASVTGPSHKLQRRSNQDCHCVRVVEVPRTEEVVDAAESREAPAAPTPGRAIVAAVADGVSSMILSGEGAHLASEAAVDAAAEAFVHGELVPGDASALKGVFEYALRAVADVAANEPAADIASFACTLCLVVWDGARVWYGNAGDSGAIAVDAAGAPFTLTHLHRGPLSCQVFPLHDTYHWVWLCRGRCWRAHGDRRHAREVADWEPGAYGAPIDFNRRPSTCLWHAISTRTTCRRSAAVRPIICVRCLRPAWMTTRRWWRSSIPRVICRRVRTRAPLR
ncbi:MAG: protein phosphatase 2C domain-containing protein [Collinsella sp.]